MDKTFLITLGQSDLENIIFDCIDRAFKYNQIGFPSIKHEKYSCDVSIHKFLNLLPSDFREILVSEILQQAAKKRVETPVDSNDSAQNIYWRDIKISIRLRNALENYFVVNKEIDRPDSLKNLQLKITKTNLLKIKNVGKKCIKELEDIFSTYGLRFIP